VGDAEVLTPRQRRFVEEFLVSMNATDAARRAGYSARSANKLGPRLLGQPAVAAAIVAGRQRLTEKAEASAERVVSEYARIAFADIRRVITWSRSGVVTIKPSDELSDDDAAVIAEVTDQATANGRTVRVKLADKLHALDSLARHLGLFVDRHEHSGPRGGPIQLGTDTIIVTGSGEEYVAKLHEVRARDRAAQAAGSAAVGP
jgi:phage terminase small subunit